MTFGRLERPLDARPMSDINMTPLIDVMLVLLVIFIVTAPLLAGSLKLELPKSSVATPSTSPSILAVSIDADGVMRVGDDAVNAQALASRAAEAAKKDAATEVQLRADSRVPYGRVAEIIGTVQQAGLTRIGFVTQTTGALPAASAPR